MNEYICHNIFKYIRISKYSSHTDMHSPDNRLKIKKVENLKDT